MIAGVTVHINPNLPWYVARAGGIVGWALIAATVIWGLAFSGKLTRHPKLPSPAWMLDLHRFLGGMAVIFTALHIAGLMLDKFVGYGPFNVAVPFTGTYRPVATAWGIVAAYLLLSVELTSLVMTRLPRKVWHGIHLSSYVIFTLATVHGLTTGTDARHGILPLVMVLTAIVVAMLTGMRVQIGIAKRTERAHRAAQRTARPSPARAAAGDGARPARERPVRDRPVRTAAASADDAGMDDETVTPRRERPVREGPVRERPVRERPVRRPVEVDAEADADPVPDDEEFLPERPSRLPERAPRVPERAARTPERSPRLPVPEPDAAHARPVREPVAARAAAAHVAYPVPGYDPRYPDPRYSDPRFADPRYADPRVGAPAYDPRYPDPRYGDPRFGGAPYADPRFPAPGYDPRYPDPRAADPRLADPRYADPRLADPRLADPRYADPRLPDPRLTDPRLADPRLADPRLTEAGYAPSSFAPPPGGYPPPAYPPAPGYPAAPGYDARSAVRPPAPPVTPPNAPVPPQGARMAPPAAAAAPAAPVPPPPAAIPPAAFAAPPPASAAPGPRVVDRDEDDDIEDAELVEDEAEAVGQTNATAPRRDAVVYPLRPPRRGAPEQASAPAVRRIPPAVTTATPAAVHRVAADGRVPDRRPVPHDRPYLPADRGIPPERALSAGPPVPGARPRAPEAQAFAADGRGRARGAVPADRRPDEPEGPSERVSGRLP